MTKHALAFAALLPFGTAYADTCHYGNPGTTVSIAPGDDSFAVLTIENKLAHRARALCDLTIYGVTVQIEYAPGSGALPDWFHVTTPRGFIAVPPSILIDDNDTGRVIIVLDGGVGS